MGFRLPVGILENLRTLKKLLFASLKYSKVDGFKLIGYSDSDFDGDKETGVSTFGYTMSLGSAAVSWRSRKQSVPADSTCRRRICGCS